MIRHRAKKVFRTVKVFPIFFVDPCSVHIPSRLSHRPWVLTQSKIDVSRPRFNSLRFCVTARLIVHLAVKCHVVPIFAEICRPITKVWIQALVVILLKSENFTYSINIPRREWYHCDGRRAKPFWMDSILDSRSRSADKLSLDFEAFQYFSSPQSACSSYVRLCGHRNYQWLSLGN